MVLATLSIIVPLVALFLGMTVQALALEEGENRILYWGDKLCLISISSTIAIAYLLYQEFLNFNSSGGSSPGLFIIFLMPFFLLLIHFILLVRSAYSHQKQNRTGRANLIGTISLVIQVIICIFYGKLFQIVISI